jgi:regulator of replication initiation timing
VHRPFVGNRFGGRIVVNRGFFPGRFHHFHSFPYVYFGGYIAPYYYGPYYADPYYYGATAYLSAYDQTERDRTYAQYQQLNGQVNDLMAENSDLRDENAQLRNDLFAQQKPSARVKQPPAQAKPGQPQSGAPQVPASPSQKSPADDSDSPPITLVYKDGRQVEVKNFAVVGKTLWILNEQRAQKVPIADLDLEKTQKVNSERGVDLPFSTAQPPASTK